ncbi:thioredoxin domain-containing protein [Thiotrichales bacterium HSG14]|nr:thioredoxin domain-containing protein [Thiotrichales bacterium HSG14]
MSIIPTTQGEENSLQGIAPYPQALNTSLQTALKAKGPNYKPRTEHLFDNGQPKFTNRLILEDSPYLLQHAHNPVDWFPWGNEAFEKANRENKPIFLSIGYSTCHWCHVMERESFDDITIARLMNEKFICIKVDRERRPEVDEIYMTAVMMITGHGGWPMSNFLTPEGKPFYGGTYFRPDTFTNLLQQITLLWQEQQPKLITQADYIANVVNQMTTASDKARQLGKHAIQEAVTDIMAKHDSFLGGFGNAPKFPSENWLLLLLEYAHRTHENVLAVVEKSLMEMAQGGIYDQIGGGFHRYATDDHWLVPHFEKMLYNQAHLARAYLLAYQLTGKLVYATVAKQTLDYVLREMTSPQGGFYSATDADSEDEEGKFFVWTPTQIRAVLDKTEAEFALNLYDVTEAGNFEGKNILYLPMSLEDYAKEHTIPLAQLIEKIDLIRTKLRLTREKREAPLRDDKIITAWNAMMIITLAMAADILEEHRYLVAAQRAAHFISSKLKKEQELWRVFLNDTASIPAHQEDYAYLIEALISLYDAGSEHVWLEHAQELTDGMLQHFWDKDTGGFFMSRKSDLLVIARPKSPDDSAIPSGNAVSVRALAMLATRTGIERYRDKANTTLNAFSSAIAKQPSRYAYMLLAADELLHGEVGMRRYGARGAVKATVKLATEEQKTWLVIELNIRNGWHINAHNPLQNDLIPTVLRFNKPQQGWQLEQIDYPKPIHRNLSWKQGTLALYEETVHLRGKLIPQTSENATNLVPIRLKFQACDDKMCLPPEQLVFNIFVRK